MNTRTHVMFLPGIINITYEKVTQ